MFFVLSLSLYIYIYMYVCMYVYIYIYVTYAYNTHHGVDCVKEGLGLTLDFLVGMRPLRSELLLLLSTIYYYHYNLCFSHPRVRPFSCLSFRKLQSRVWENLERVGGPSMFASQHKIRFGLSFRARDSDISNKRVARFRFNCCVARCVAALGQGA